MDMSTLLMHTYRLIVKPSSSCAPVNGCNDSCLIIDMDIDTL